MGLLSRIFKPKVEKTWSSVQALPWNWWQVNTVPLSQSEYGKFGPVYACWSIISQEVSRVPLKHIRRTPDGRLEAVHNKAPLRVMRNPNRYQTRSDFLMYMTRSLLSDGNAYAVAVRNDRYEISELYPMPPRACWPHIDPETGEVFYRISDSETSSLANINPEEWRPARDVLHIRLFTPLSPLVGESPLTAAAAPVQAGANINSRVSHFFGNMSRPSGILRHPKSLNNDAILRLKEAFKKATTGENVGVPVVLTEDMDWKAMDMSAVDAQLVESFRLTERQVAQIYRVPQFFLGEDAKFATVESMTRFFINSGLGFYFDHISDSLTKFFKLPQDEEIIFDYETALLQADTESRISAYTKAIQGGIYSPNEARAKEGLPPVEYGDQPRVQQQLVPLSYGIEVMMQEPQAAPALPAPEPEEEDPEMRSLRIRLMAEKLRSMSNG